jgi:hypothetical protein
MVDLIPGEIVQRPVFVAHSSMSRFVGAKVCWGYDLLALKK